MVPHFASRCCRQPYANGSGAARGLPAIQSAICATMGPPAQPAACRSRGRSRACWATSRSGRARWALEPWRWHWRCCHRPRRWLAPGQGRWSALEGPVNRENSQGSGQHVLDWPWLCRKPSRHHSSGGSGSGRADECATKPSRPPHCARLVRTVSRLCAALSAVPGGCYLFGMLPGDKRRPGGTQGQGPAACRFPGGHGASGVPWRLDKVKNKCMPSTLLAPRAGGGAAMALTGTAAPAAPDNPMLPPFLLICCRSCTAQEEACMFAKEMSHETFLKAAPEFQGAATLPGPPAACGHLAAHGR